MHHFCTNLIPFLILQDLLYSFNSDRLILSQILSANTPDFRKMMRMDIEQFQEILAAIDMNLCGRSGIKT